MGEAFSRCVKYGNFDTERPISSGEHKLRQCRFNVHPPSKTAGEH